MIGKTISHYKILSKLGSGGMGEVYMGEDTKLDRKVALKFLPAHLTKDQEATERFEREAKAIAPLSYPNILAIHGAAGCGAVSASSRDVHRRINWSRRPASANR